MTPIPKFRSRRRRLGGFTLLELMVSLAITTTILVILLGVTRAAIDSWQINSERVRATRQAKLALDQMSKDFESFQMRAGNDFEWLTAKVDDGVGDDNVAGGNAAQIAFFTAATDRYNGQGGVDGVDRGGDISAVGYRLVYKDPVKSAAGEFAVFALYRSLVDPDTAFADLLRQESLMDGARGAEGPFQKYMDEAGEISHFVCENIHGLSVTFLIEYEGQQGRTRVTKHQRLSVIDTDGDTAVDVFRIKGKGIFAEPNPDNWEEIRRGKIVSVEISVSVITDSAMNALRNGSFSPDEAALIAAKNSYRFSKTVRLNHL